MAANFDPIHGSGATACPAVKPATGVSVKALFGFDEVPGPPSDLCGNGVVDPGEQCDRNDSTTVLPSCADFGLEPNIDDHVSCFTNCSYNKAACKPPTFDSCSKTSGMPQACDAGGTVPASTSCETLGLGSGFLACFNCSVNVSGCGTAPTCGNGVVDAGEECDLGALNGTSAPIPGPNGNVTCGQFYRDTVGLVRCSGKCAFDKAECNPACALVAGRTEACADDGSGRLAPPSDCEDNGFGRGDATCLYCSLSLSPCGPAFDGSTWEKARATSHEESGWFLAVDGRGQRHLFRLYATRVGDNRLKINVIGQGEEYVGGLSGNTQSIRTLLVDFDPATRAVTGVKSGNGPVVTGPTGTMTMGGVPTDGTGEGTPAFAESPDFPVAAGPLTLTVDFSQVTRDGWQPYNSTSKSNSTIFLPGGAVTAGVSGSERPIARCRLESVCTELWSDTTQRWEGSQQRWDQKYHGLVSPVANSVVGLSDWEFIAKSMPHEFGLTAELATDRPQALPPTDCGGDLAWEPEPAMGLTPDAVVLVIDHSGSMETHIDAETDLGPGVGETRLAFAQAASRDFVDLLVNRAGRVAGAGLVSFDSAATLNQAIAEVIRSGTPGAGQVTLDSFKGVVNTLAPGGRTAIGLGLKQAGDMLAATTFSAKTIVLLSDGENNEPTPLGDADPLSVATNLGKQGVRIFTVPTGKAADKMLLGNIAAVANGTMFEAPIGDELPSIYAEAFALSNGETLTVPRTSVTVANTTPCMEREIQLCNVGNQIESNFGCICKVAGEIPIKTQLFDVEEGATQLNIFLSARNIDVDAWDPSFALIDPSGTLRLTDASPGIASDRFYRLVTLANPEPGRWQLEIAAVGNDEPQIQYLQVHVAGEGPDCYPRLSRIVVSDTESEVLSVDTSYAGRAIQGVSTFVDLYRPDGSMVSLAIEGSDSSGVKFAAIDPSLYVGRGIYRAETYCTTSEQSTYVLGEGATGPEPGDEGNRPLPFARRASKSFFVDSDAYPPLPPGGDCDRNGIPDSAEPTGDFDGDGLPDVCDQDDDNDDAPEPGDPDPRSSTCHFTSCPVANAGPDQTIECSSPDGTAIATLNATASSDPDGQALTYAWASSVPLQDSNLAMATGTFPLGTREAKLTVSDGTNEVSDTTLITVIDTTPPSLTPPPDVFTPTCGTVNIGTATGTDACGGTISITSNAPATFPRAGKTVVTWHALDQFGNEATATQVVVVGVGNNRSCCPVGTHVVVGTSNNDILTGTSGADCILGLGAQDTINGLGGNDYLSGGDGDDVVEGGEGDDQLEGGAGQDTLRGQNGNDIISGFDGDDQCYGASGDDRLFGGQGQDKLYGDDGNDALFGEGGDDRLEGGNGNDLLSGGSGTHNVCIGGPGTNTLLMCQTQG